MDKSNRVNVSFNGVGRATTFEVILVCVVLLFVVLLIASFLPTGRVSDSSRQSFSADITKETHKPTVSTPVKTAVFSKYQESAPESPVQYGPEELPTTKQSPSERLKANQKLIHISTLMKNIRALLDKTTLSGNLNPKAIENQIRLLLDHPDFSREGKLQGYWELINEYKNDEELYAFLLNTLRQYSPIELINELVFEYRDAANESHKVELVEVMRSAFAEEESLKSEYQDLDQKDLDRLSMIQFEKKVLNDIILNDFMNESDSEKELNLELQVSAVLLAEPSESVQLLSRNILSKHNKQGQYDAITTALNIALFHEEYQAKYFEFLLESVESYPPDVRDLFYESLNNAIMQDEHILTEDSQDILNSYL